MRLNDANGENIAWLQHPTHGPAIDVAAVRIPQIETISTMGGEQETYVFESGSVRANLDEFLSDLPPWDGPRRDMGDDLFILGFPLGLKVTGHFPLWKRASVASEMDVLVEGKHSFLVDTATREGMSGAPVVYIDRSGPLTHSGEFELGRKISFMGTYSGRHIGDKQTEAQLGIVWREKLINEIIASKKPGYIDLSLLPG